MFVKAKLRFLFFSVLLIAVLFTTCDTPLGMGLPIDWESPVLTVDPVPSPIYVHSNMTLTGKVTDNVGVERVIFIDTATGKELFPVIIDGDNWRVELSFTEEQNGEKIVAQIIAYDKMGNSDGRSTAFFTLYIDIRPPVVEYIDIKRTDSRMANLESYTILHELENFDPNGDRKSELYKYQNGWFYVNGIVSDKETKVEDIKLEFYDYRYMNECLISLSVDENYTPYFPRWTVKEEDIINKGQAILGAADKLPNYKTDYYDNNARYYYRVVIRAIDKADNDSVTDIEIEEDKGFICMWAESDNPKGVIDRGIGAIISRGTPLPVDFYDDDSLLWAYGGLLTEEQWNGTKPVYAESVSIVGGEPEYVGGVYISGSTDDQKLLWLKTRLTGNPGDSVVKGTGTPVYNWKLDKHASYSFVEEKFDPIVELIGTSSIDEKLVYISTGNDEGDYGNYILFTLIADKKLAPHTGTGPNNTNKSIWAGGARPVQIIDENAPLIVFDKTKGCPEENTFPDPLLAAGGDPEQKYFDIVGYTLRENSSDKNRVIRFRMAWIPYNMPGADGNPAADSYIPAVQTALRNNFVGMPPGVQYWDFVEDGEAPDGNFIDEGNDLTIPITTGLYRKQAFKKRFSVLGDIDDLKPEYENFKYDYLLADGKTPGKDGIPDLENETKLFIFYALDNMGHEVYRQLRLLGYKTPPELSVFDVTNKTALATMPSGYPNPTLDMYYDNATGSPNDDYYAALNTYNARTGVYNRLRNESVTNVDLSEAFQIYPRGAIVKYKISAIRDGKIGIKNITMQDITFTKKQNIGSGYNITDNALTFCEFYPDVTQRTFLFEAEDKLGNIARVQRTIAVTNAARLENITTTSQNGVYGIGKDIVLKANFSSLIYVKGDSKPKLNVRYQNARPPYEYEYTSVSCESPPTTKETSALALEFKFTVDVNYGGKLETMWDGISGYSGADDGKRPIDLNGATIVDSERGDSAFIPGYMTESVTMPNWTSVANSLQSKKEIELDGIRPNITAVSWGGKTAYSGSNYYFKDGEAIEVTITADKDIRATTTNPSMLQYHIIAANGADTGPYTAHFKYQKPGVDSKSLIYSLPVNKASCPNDGKLADVILYTSGVNSGNIVDGAENTAVVTIPLLPASTNIYIKIDRPAMPPAATTLLGGASFGANDTFNSNPALVIPVSGSEWRGSSPYVPWEDGIQYSVNGGLNWLPTTPSTTQINVNPVVSSNGTHTIQARYIDRAGNEGFARSQRIELNNNFPALVSVNAVQANGYYNGGNLTINLNFADQVRVTNRANVTITLKNRSTDGLNGTNGQSNPPAIQTNQANSTISPFTYHTTLTFTLTIDSGMEMRDGLYISAVNLAGLTDRFGSTGGSGTATCTAATLGTPGTPSTISVNACPNLAAGLIVDNVDPTVTVRSPLHNTAPTLGNNDLITQLQITFREPVMKGSGTITIRPRGNYAIPPVLEDTGYYLGYTNNGQASGTYSQTGTPTKNPTYNGPKTYISSFYDIYNALTDSANRTAMTKGSSMSNLTPNDRTGQSTGPYIKMTHGLISGAGYSGSYNNGTGADGPNLANTSGVAVHSAMVPDTATKWVLDYQYGITQNVAAVTSIRNALTAAKWRWQESDVVNTTVAGTDNRVVTITLSEPLLKGLEWDVYYPKGAFTDIAGNPAPASDNTTYYFTSPGVQPPVIRVNRRSYDAKNNNWKAATVVYGAPPNSTDWDINTTNFAVNGTPSTTTTGDNGWGIGNFNTVHYRVESESSAVSGAGVTAQYFQASDTPAVITDNRSAVIAAWSGDVQTTNTGVTSITTRAWDFVSTNTATAHTTTPGTWILSNLISRNYTSAAQGVTGLGVRTPYTVITKNGSPESRTSQGNLRMFRSYNRDLTQAELNGALPSATLNSNGQGIFTFSSLEASKNYVVGTATLNGVSAKGYEGVFRTVIMFNYGNDRGRYFAVQGSNLKNGMPSIAGFPVRDAEETGDNWYNKVFYNNNADAGPYRQFYWVSTEIVCEWYFLTWGGNSRATGPGNNTGTGDAGNSNGSHQNVGEVNNYLTVGYGDLTYGYNIGCSNMTGN
jgi:predicted small secreted protein